MKKINQNKIDIKSLSKNELVKWLESIGEKAYRAEQILKWIYQYQSDSFKNMTNINQELKKTLSENFFIERLSLISIVKSKDGSKKYSFSLSDDNIVECLLIPEKKHLTLCVSSQIGCAYNCDFCMSSKNGLIRNLKFQEIVSQLREVKQEIKNKKEYQLPLSNIVFMGMGEPLSNYSQVLKAIKIISNNDYGIRISPRNITISTVGLVPKLKLLGKEKKINLAISLNASNNKTRSLLMPINKIYPIEILIKACKNYPLRKRQKITFEYVLIKNINDSLSDAKELASLIKGIRAKINLIPFNEHSDKKYETSSLENILKFQKILINEKYITTIRFSKGKDIFGACGQLRAKEELKRQKS